jgi:transcriptional regulator with XRE-family HTH domain
MREDGSILVSRVLGRLKYSRTQLADVLGVHHAVISNWENSMAKPPQTAMMIMNLMLGNEIRLKPRLSGKSLINKGKTELGKILESRRIKLNYTTTQWADALSITPDRYYYVMQAKGDTYLYLLTEMQKIKEM